jgi:hypothetical protein
MRRGPRHLQDRILPPQFDREVGFHASERAPAAARRGARN